MNALKPLQKPAVAAVLLLGLLLFYNVNSAFAASGGRMGGSSFRSSSSKSRSSSSSSSSSSSLRRWSSSSSSTRSWSCLSCDSETYEGKTIVVERSSNNSGHVDWGKLEPGTRTGFAVVLVVVIVIVIASAIAHNSDRETGKNSVSESTGETTTVLKLQIGLLNLGRSLQKDLKRIAKTADTSSKHGLHYILTETVLALLRQPDYCCISAYTTIHVMRNMEEGEKRFHQLSIEERAKFDEETLVNVSNIKKQSSTILRSTGSSNEQIMINVKRNMGDRRNRFHLLSVEESDEPDDKTFVKINNTNEHIVITILVAAEGLLKLPDINNRKDLRKGLQELASLPLSTTLAVEVLWTPQKEDDSLSEHEMRIKYPLLRRL